jgi:hypothetical protein
MLNLEELAVNPEFRKKELESGLRTLPTKGGNEIGSWIKDFWLKRRTTKFSGLHPKEHLVWRE